MRSTFLGDVGDTSNTLYEGDAWRRKAFWQRTIFNYLFVGVDKEKHVLLCQCKDWVRTVQYERHNCLAHTCWYTLVCILMPDFIIFQKMFAKTDLRTLASSERQRGLRLTCGSHFANEVSSGTAPRCKSILFLTACCRSQNRKIISIPFCHLHD